MKQINDDNVLFDAIGYVVALLALGAAGVAFWFLFCHPASQTEALVPILRPIRITVTCGLAFACYQYLSRKRSIVAVTSRKGELMLILFLVGCLGAARFFFGQPDGSTIRGTDLDDAVQWSQMLGLVLPALTFAILGYLVGNRRDMDRDLVKTEPENSTGSVSGPQSAAQSLSIRSLGISLLQVFMPGRFRVTERQNRACSSARYFV